jgi:L-amino acid N-acyltransferase YncA
MLGALMTERDFSFRGILSSMRASKTSPNTNQSVTIRSAARDDCAEICEIYNFYIKSSVITFDEQPMDPLSWQDKLRQVQDLNLPFIVATSVSGQLFGFAYLAPWRQKSAYRRTVENTIYLKPTAIGQGLGPPLLSELLRLGKAAGIKEVVAVISNSEADASIKMHKKFGFKKVGELPRVGFKFDRWLGVILLQKSL